MGLTDNIRRYVCENMIKPAKDRGDKEVTARAGDIHEALGLSSRMPSVCSALKAGMEKLCNVEVVNVIAPPSGMGANVYVTYRLLEGDALPSTAKPVIKQSNSDMDALSEDEIKEVLEKHLKSNGWNTSIAWGHAHGVDIDAIKNNKRWLIEVKGPGSRQPMRVNYFIGILGEILQRMNDPGAKYSIAFPDLDQFRGLWERLPALAKHRTQITILFIDRDGTVEELTS